MNTTADPTNATTAVAERANRIKDTILTGVSSATEPIRTRATMYRMERRRDGLLRELGQLHVNASNAGIAADTDEIEALIVEINATTEIDTDEVDR